MVTFSVFSEIRQNQRLVFASEGGHFIFTAAENDGTFLTADRIDGAKHAFLGRFTHSQIGVFEVHRTAVGDIALEQQIPAAFGADDVEDGICVRVESLIGTDLSGTLDSHVGVRRFDADRGRRFHLEGVIAQQRERRTA